MSIPLFSGETPQFDPFRQRLDCLKMLCDRHH
jgi:hypothetical protein